MSIATLPAAQDLDWRTPEIPIEAARCPVDWCNGLHDEANSIGVTHGTDIISATRDGNLVLEVAVSQWFSFGTWRLLNGRTVTEMPRKAAIMVITYADGRVSKMCLFETPEEAERVNRIFVALGQHELADAITKAISLARLANRRIPR